MQEGTSTLATDGQDTFWYYTTDPGITSVSVATLTGDWTAATPGLDPNGVAGWAVRLSGPAAPAGAGSVMLSYGTNPLRVQLSTGQVVSGGSVYVGTTGVWADAYLPTIYSEIVTGHADPAAIVPHPLPFTVDQALRVASDVLTALTANQLHPPGSAIETWTGAWPLHRLVFTHKPVTHIDTVRRIDWNFNETAVTADEYRLSGQAIIFKPFQRNVGGLLCGGFGDMLALGSVGTYGNGRYGNGFALSAYSGGVGTETIQIGYQFGNTITATARAAAVYFAHQIYLGYIQSDLCQLPTRTSSITREGVSFQVDVSQEFLSMGHTGLPVVDQFISAANPSAGVGRYASARANRPSGVYTPSSPAGVTLSYRTTV